MKEKIVKLLADYLGIEPSDISDDDSLTEELHMTPSDIADFTEVLAKSDIDISDLDMSDVETVTDLYDKFI